MNELLVSALHDGSVIVHFRSGNSDLIHSREMQSVISTAADESFEVFSLPTVREATSIHIVDPLSDNRWDELVARHPQSSVFHQRPWLKALAKTYGYMPLAFTTSGPRARLDDGLVVCQIKSLITGSRVVSLPFSDHCEPICSSTEEMKSLICEAQSEFSSHRWRYLEVRPTGNGFSEMGRELGFQPTGRYFRHVLDLSPGGDDLLRSFHKDSVQRRIRHASKSSLVEKHGASSELLSEFYKLFVLTRSRHHLPPPPYAWFQNLVECLGSSLEIRVAYKNEIPIAAVLTLQFKKTAYFKYGCSDARFNRFGATPWLLWNAIQAAKAEGALWFDFGRTQTDNPGLLKFKNHWVPRSEPLTYWRYPAFPSKRGDSDWKLRTAKRFFSHLPNELLVLSGKLIYPHIG